MVTNLKVDKSLSLNNKFPFYEFNFGEKLSRNVQLSQYTLIDFWATYCKPCIAQFPDFVKIYAAYHSKGFNIYGISIDRQDVAKRRENVIDDKGITWPNVLDDNGTEAKKINIFDIPRNFLLDSEGKIIAKDISAAELETFLKASFKLIIYTCQG